MIKVENDLAPIINSVQRNVRRIKVIKASLLGFIGNMKFCF